MSDNSHGEKKTPLMNPGADPCNVFALRKAARAASRYYGKIMRDCGLKHTQFSVLAILHQQGDQSISELARLLGLERTSMSRTLTPLQKEGLLSVSEEGARRVRTVSISVAGRQRLEQALPLWREAQARFKADIGTDRVAELQQLLGLVSAAEIN